MKSSIFLKKSLVAACIALTLEVAAAAELPSTNGPYAYYADRVQIGKVLQDYCNVIGATLKMDAGISATINGRLNAATGKEFLDRLTSNYGLSWYYHGGILHVAKLTRQETKSFPVSAGSISGLKVALKELGVLDDRFGWAELVDQGLVIVSGPPDYVQIVGKTITGLPLAPSGQQQVFVFRLKHASVEDRTIFYRDKQRIVVGIATILKNLISAPGRGQPGAIQQTGLDQLTNAGIVSPLPSALGSMSPPSLSSPLPGPIPRLQDATSDSGRSGGQPASGKSKGTGANDDANSKSAFEAGGGATIEADTRLNAIIIKDAPERFPMYQKLIAMLDVQVPMIEIEARIIDISTSKLSELGFDWTAGAKNASLSFGDPNRAPGLSDIALGVRARVASNTVILDGASWLLARIRALESVGDARTVSRPTILTTDNLGAVIDLSQTFYTSVSGERVANLVPVTVGTMLKVTPHMIEKDGERHIQMVVDIEDGTLISRAGISLPLVQKSTIATQAVILENQSMLIAGYKSEVSQNREVRLPLFSDIPVLGKLFVSTEKDGTKLDRLFLITPRIVDPSALAKAITPALELQQRSAVPPASAPLPPSMPAADDLPTRVPVREKSTKLSLTNRVESKRRVSTTTPPYSPQPFLNPQELFEHVPTSGKSATTQGLKMATSLHLPLLRNVSTALALQAEPSSSVRNDD